MTHISTGVEYALHCLTFLAGPEGSRSGSARDLAELQGVSVDFVAKLFTKLQKTGIVAAAEGVRGGFSLARDARDISFLDVIDAIDGPKPLFECKNIRTECALFEGNPPAWSSRGMCAIHAVMVEADNRVRDLLAQRSLAEITGQLTAKAPPDYDDAIGSWLADRVPNRSARRSPQ